MENADLDKAIVTERSRIIISGQLNASRRAAKEANGCESVSSRDVQLCHSLQPHEFLDIKSDIAVEIYRSTKSKASFGADKFVNESRKAAVHLFRDRFATSRVNRKEGDEEERGVERSGRRAENKKRAKWSAGPVVSCDRKWHSFFASLPSSSTKPRGACTSKGREIGDAPMPCTLFPLFKGRYVPPHGHTTVTDKDLRRVRLSDADVTRGDSGGGGSGGASSEWTRA
ncbi:hypothetical protein EAG_04059 [Camponotus floridanus]|uniref:Uncharacterized protein n=1 Tax=Camponotus floridanus TaxID=104421 RepID=E2B1X5_CAMFO|nr:hypothetical protein EAG_04059 [Camponotus floridanus]